MVLMLMLLHVCLLWIYDYNLDDFVLWVVDEIVDCLSSYVELGDCLIYQGNAIMGYGNSRFWSHRREFLVSGYCPSG